MIEFLLRSECPALLVRRQQTAGPPVLYVHGATFPSALSAAYRFNGRSWMDDWNARGFDAWAFDLAGYGGSDRYEEMHGDCAGAPLGRAPQAAEQIARVVEHIAGTTGHESIFIVVHSWGTIPAAMFAVREPARVAKLCLFGPVLQRNGEAGAASNERWRQVTIAQQLARFIADVPQDHPPVLIEPQLQAWGPAYLASDPGAATRNPPAVRIPTGPAADIADAWSGHLAWRPQALRCPVLCVRGEWDSMTNDADAAWLKAQLPSCRDVKIAEGTHLMHLEHSREGLFAAVTAFLKETQ